MVGGPSDMVQVSLTVAAKRMVVLIGRNDYQHQKSLRSQTLSLQQEHGAMMLRELLRPVEYTSACVEFCCGKGGKGCHYMMMLKILKNTTTHRVQITHYSGLKAQKP